MLVWFIPAGGEDLVPGSCTFTHEWVRLKLDSVLVLTVGELYGDFNVVPQCCLFNIFILN